MSATTELTIDVSIRPRCEALLARWKTMEAEVLAVYAEAVALRAEYSAIVASFVAISGEDLDLEAVHDTLGKLTGWEAAWEPLHNLVDGHARFPYNDH